MTEVKERHEGAAAMMTPQQIQRFATPAINACAEYEETRCANGTAATLTLLAEIAERLANIDQALQAIHIELGRGTP